MKDTIIKTVACIAALIGLLMLVGDMPEATISQFVTAKLCGMGLLWAGAKAIDRYTPEEL